ncbi:MAG: hypothetical protein OXT69_14785 [Candidatus Poribacteria bacterium]|nr:hypothetical protein [Candidatus Poribacteria bacterium]
MNIRWKWILAACIGFVVILWIFSALENAGKKRTVTRSPSSSRYQGVVGVGSSGVTAKIDLTDNLNPAILPDLLRSILEEIAPTEKPETTAFQQKVVQTLSQRIMEDPDVNYQVDLNEDDNVDPVLVVPEAVDDEAAVYSIRVPDPEKHPKDPSPTDQTTDWSKIAEEGVELCAVSATFDEQAKSITVDAAPNQHLYTGSGSSTHYRETYPASRHSWMETYFAYRLFSDVLFGPRYGWYGPGWYGGWYGGYYGGVNRNVTVRRNITRTQTKYRTAGRQSSAMRTSKGNAASSSASRRTTPPSFVRRQSSSASRVGSSSTRSTTTRPSSTSTRSTYRPSTSSRSSSSRSSSTFRSSGSSYRGGGFSFGK